MDVRNVSILGKREGVLYLGENVWLHPTKLRSCKDSHSKEALGCVPLHFALSIYGLTSILSQFRKHFLAWQDNYRKDKWVDLRRINPISIYFSDAPACLSNPVQQHTDEGGTCSCCYYYRKQPVSWNLFHSFTQSSVTGLLAWPECQTLWKKTIWVRHNGRALWLNISWFSFLLY